MKTELKKYKLKDLLKIKNGQDHKGLHDGCYPVYGSGGIMRHVSTFLYDKPSVLLPRKGSLSNIQYCDSPFWTVDTLYYTEVNREMANPYYLYRYLSLLDLSGLDSGTGVPSMTFDSYYNISVWLPDVNLQNRISSVLSNIDRKIVLNHQINDNLEKMAKQLYDYWFVQFDFPDENGRPYKSSGGAMVWNEKLKREIPQGWNNQKIKDFMRVFTGKKDVSKAIPGDFKFFSCAPEPITSNEYIYDGYAVLVSGNGSYTGRVSFYKGKFDLYQRTYACVLDKNVYNISFFYYTLRYLFQPIYSGGKHGSSIPYIVLGDLTDFSFTFNDAICKKFVDAVKPMFDEQLLRQQEIEALTKQRDELLPLLMNGQASLNYHLSEWSIGFLCLDMHIEYDKGIVQKEANGQDFHPPIRQPYSFTFFKHTSDPFLMFILQFKLFVTMSHKLPTDFHNKVHTNVVQRF